jgi:hypothetical protein
VTTKEQTMRTRTVLAAIGAIAAAGAAMATAPTAFASERPSSSVNATTTDDRDPPRDDPAAWHTSRRLATEAQCNSLRNLLISRGFEVKAEGCYKDEIFSDDGPDAPPVPHSWIWRFQYRGNQS